MPDWITLTEANIADEHICCAFSSKEAVEGYEAKKRWLKEQFAEGYKFRRLDANAKVFVEYGPAEKAWSPVDANGWTLINCLWVSGSYKGHGYAAELINACIEDSKDSKGLVVVSSAKKKAFMTDKSFFEKYGFGVVDTAPPYFELLAKPFRDEPAPAFRKNAKECAVDKKGIVVYYTNRCPFTVQYSGVLGGIAKSRGIPFETVPVTTLDAARDFPCAQSIWAVFYDGKFVTHEIIAPSKFDKYFEPFLK